MKIAPDKIDEYLEGRLQDWGEWLRTGNQLGIGYPAHSMVQLILEGKIITNNKQFWSFLEVHEEAEEIEKLVAEMSLYKRPMADCLRMHYMDNVSIRRNAKRAGISYSYYNLYLQMARQWLIGKLS